MTPVNCRIKHAPPDQYGDCIRACIATVLDADAEAVPHFAHDNPSPDVLMQRIRDYLRPNGHTIFITQYPPVPLDELLTVQATVNPDAVYLLFGGVDGGGDHVVVCRGGAVVHNPAWYHCSIVQPASHGMWQVLVVARL